MHTWSDLAAAELSAPQLHDLLQLRNRVFVVEQECAYLDIDGLDLLPTTRHVLASSADGLVGCARLLVDDGFVRVGRIVVAPGARGTGVGREVVRRSLAACSAHWPGQPIRIAAQAHLERFYAEFGFAVRGEPYEEDGIPHVDMQLGSARA
ncbi:GNAT family N-acetyltransferase [Nocardioides alcanivorans]|uniref:GNAT family N-acetyltransferase n=1 Tax=Nocardioides alcanivorans TaxID=2897352 RepID=UPI001F35B474|nr:GNAT family N-acetyltransferase [Nocardioides alcanivorans]